MLVTPGRGGIRGAPALQRNRVDRGAEFFAQVEQSGPLGAEQPFVAAGGVGVAAERLDVDRNATNRLGAVDHGEAAVRAGERGEFGHLHPQPGGGEEMREREDARGRSDLPCEAIDDGAGIVLAGWNDDHVDRDAEATGDVVPADATAGVFLIGGEDPIAGVKGESLGDGVDAVGGALVSTSSSVLQPRNAAASARTPSIPFSCEPYP